MRLVEAVEDADVVVPAALVERDERHAGLDQPPGQQAPLAERRCGRRRRGRVSGSRRMSKAAWASCERHQVVALLVILVERHGRVAGRLVGEPPEAVDAGAEVAAAVEPVVGQAARQGDVADPEVRRCSGCRGRRTGRTSRPGSSARRSATCCGIEKYAGRPAGRPALVGGDRAQAGVEADERAAADRDPRRGAGHHVVVARAVVALVVADRPHDGELVGDRRQPLHVLGEVDAGDLGGDRRRTRRGSRSGASGLGSNVS